VRIVRVAEEDVRVPESVVVVKHRV
jgi:hypothetical protein